MSVQRPKKVLVVDDQEDLLSLETMILAEAGYQVDCAANGQEALEHTAKEPPDLVLLDLRMPVMGGAEFARQFRACHDGRVPIIVVTAAADAKRRAEEVGADGWLAKPFELDTLLALVRFYLSAWEDSAPRSSS